LNRYNDFSTWPVFPAGAQQSSAASGVTIVASIPGMSRSSSQGRVVTMDKWLCWGSMGVAGFLLLLFLLDLVLGFPFGGVSGFVDFLGILASGLVLYLAWDASRELR
jgi:hypothetical protein